MSKRKGYQWNGCFGCYKVGQACVSGRSSPRLPITPALHRDFAGTGEHEQPHPCPTGPPWQEEHGPNAVGGRRGFRDCCTFHLNQTPCPLQSPLTNKALKKCTWLQGVFHHFLFFPTQLPHHWANALMDTYHYLISDLMGTANKWKAHKIKFTEHHSFCCPLTETIYQVKQIQAMGLYSSCINAVAGTFQDPRLSSNGRECCEAKLLLLEGFQGHEGGTSPERWVGFSSLKHEGAPANWLLQHSQEQESAVNLADSVWFINTKTRNGLDKL